MPAPDGPDTRGGLPQRGLHRGDASASSEPAHPEASRPEPPHLAGPRADALAFLDGRRDAMVSRLRSWCQQNSGSTNLPGLQRMADSLVADFEPLGVPCQRLGTSPYTVVDEQGQEVERESGELLRWQYAAGARHRLLLMIHYDTVYDPPHSAAEQETPAAPPSACRLESGGKLVGPGTADAKGGLLVMREALLAARHFNLDEGIGWTAVANPDEEIGSPASAQLIAEMARQHDFGLVFEPSLPDGALVAARKGSGNFTVVVRGRAAHAGRNPQDGRNAVVHLCRLLSEIDQLGADRGGVTINVGRVGGGGALNRVPDLAIGRFNVRVGDLETQTRLLERLNKAVERYRAVEGFRVTLHGGFHAPPKVVDAPLRDLQRRVERAAAVLGRSVHWRDTGGASDGNKLSAAGLANIDTLGPTGDLLHSPGEWVDIESLVPAAKTLLMIIAQYAEEVRTGGGMGKH